MSKMQTIQGLVQGSPEWKRFRQQYRVASEAPVIMGDSPHMKRDELIWLKMSGEEKAHSDWVEKFVFKRGHQTEALARPIAERRLGEDLFPVTGVRTVDGLPLLASFDGLTLFEDMSWEHKQYAKALFELVQNGGPLEPRHYWQLEHQMLVADIDQCIFAVSDGTEDNYAELVYRSVPERRERLLEGWRLFESDLGSSDYVPATQEPDVVGRAPGDLPALHVEATGAVTASNLAEFREVALESLGAISTELHSDEDFANAKKTVKWCKDVENRLATVKETVLAQTASIDELFRSLDDLGEEFRQVRLNLDRKVSTREKEIKIEIADNARARLNEHVKMLNKALGEDLVPTIAADFTGAMKNKRTRSSLESATNDELANARIEANRIANRIEENLEFFDKAAEGFEFLFPDRRGLVVEHDKEPLQALVKRRIADHQEAERAKAEREAAAKAKAEAAPAPEAPARDNVRAMPERRPPDTRIIEVLSDHYRVPIKTVIKWLLEMDLEMAAADLAERA